MASRRERSRLKLLQCWGAATRLLSGAQAPSLPTNPRVLVIRPDHLGDLLLTAPAIRLLRAALPDAHITALVGPWGAGIVQRYPEIDAIRACPFPGFTRQPKGSALAPYGLLVREAIALRGAYDLAIVLRFDHWWGAWLAQAAGIPHRWGYAIPECAPFLTTAIPYEPGHHEVAQSLGLIEQGCQQAGIPLPIDVPTSLHYTVRSEEEQAVTALLSQHGLEGHRPLIAIHPGAGAPVKLWPASRYAKIADALISSLKAAILITGSRDELDLAWQVAAHMRHDATVLAGETSLGQLAALLARCDLVIGSDSGPLHLAVAVGAPTLHMYGPVDPALFGPWAPGDETRHLALTSPRHCVPCNRLDYDLDELTDHPCMAEIEVETVLDALASIIPAQ